MVHPSVHHLPLPLGGVAPSTVIPAGRLSKVKEQSLTAPAGNRVKRLPQGWGGTDHPREVIEAALAHVVRNKVEAAFARSDLFERRRVLMDDWARYLAEPTREEPPARQEEFLGASITVTICSNFT